MSIVKKLQEAVVSSLTNLYNQPFTDKDFQINLTNSALASNHVDWPAMPVSQELVMSFSLRKVESDNAADVALTKKYFL